MGQSWANAGVQTCSVLRLVSLPENRVRAQVRVVARVSQKSRIFKARKAA
jgi:hypothetical protein